MFLLEHHGVFFKLFTYFLFAVNEAITKRVFPNILSFCCGKFAREVMCPMEVLGGEFNECIYIINKKAPVCLCKT